MTRSATAAGRGWGSVDTHTALGVTGAGMRLEVTVVGGTTGIATRAVATLSELLRRWDVTEESSLLRRLWRERKPMPVDDETLLLLALTTHAALDLDQGVAHLAGDDAVPDPHLVRALAIDMTVQDLQLEPVSGLSVQAGAACCVRGTSPYGGRWSLEVPAAGGLPLDVANVTEGALVSVPATGSGLSEVTVYAETAWRAATLAIMAGRLPLPAACQLLLDAGVSARLHVPGGHQDIGPW